MRNGRKTHAAPRILMDAKLHARMIRGRIAPEARLDLHGLTLAEAHPALVAFILRAHRDHRRLVLVITGKGRAPDPHLMRHGTGGILRQQVPQWLRLPPLGGVVLQSGEAHRRHGGAGALYVYLRRR